MTARRLARREPLRMIRLGVATLDKDLPLPARRALIRIIRGILNGALSGLGLVMLCLMGLDAAMAEHPHADDRFRSLQTDEDSVRGQYRWRPLDGEAPAVHRTDQPSQPSVLIEQRYPPVTDYAETPPGIPRGVYRPVEGRHDITPHYEGYRFRSLSPSEQSRIKRRNQENRWSRAKLENGGRRKIPATPYVKDDSDNWGGYTFRPDKRLDKNERGGAVFSSPYLPAFSDAYPAPQFRRD
ncbi:MAG: hypothetical protein KZQ76_03770 [Candidatus Thiodiazotropha sp. (ex Epidulcina cf. delphinae)]|nr:hypothetical protein [Candidatus Thiodiazotropha sp. (ex Epidulcina cf. delphinae)]